MIYIYPIGGLGNMFFHIASIWSLAKDNNDELCLNNVDKKIYDLDNDDRWDSKHAEKYRYVFDRLPNKKGSYPILDYPFSFVPIKYQNERQYCGYFQSERYFKHRRSEILNLFRPSEEALNKVNEYKDLFENISLHVRRTDYVKLYPNIHVPQTTEYYSNALEKLPKDLKVLVFSDDLKWCKENFIGDRFVFIEEVDYIAIYLMSKMKHHVIANSSFSWWGAWMSEHQDKTIIAPKVWFGGRKSAFEKNMNMIPSDWIRI